jgi:hypothetical protein
MTEAKRPLTEKEKEAILKAKRKAFTALHKTKRLMAIGFLIAELEEELAAYKKAILANTATKKQVAKLYFLMNDLGSKNRGIKGCFKDG